jgi:hypothetical protein
LNAKLSSLAVNIAQSLRNLVSLVSFKVGLNQVSFQVFQPKVSKVCRFIRPRALEQDLLLIVRRLVSGTELF